MPLPRQSVISDAACCNTSSGSIAGPALKLNTRDIQLLINNLYKLCGTLLNNC
jgi:hypothetical protein